MKKILQWNWKMLKKSKLLRIITAAEAAVILLLFINCFRGSCDYYFSADDLLSYGESVQAVMDDQGEQVEGYYAANENSVDGDMILCTEYFSLYPGAYHVKINYSSQVNYMEESSITEGLSTLSLTSTHNEIFARFESLLLRDGTDTVEQTVQITSPWSIDDLRLTVNFYGQGELTVYSLEIQEIMAYRYVCLLMVLFLFVGADIIGCLLLVDSQFKREKELGILTVICLAGILPFMADWIFQGHDIQFQAYRIILLAEDLSLGNYFPAIYTAALNDYGYAAPLFYCHLFLYPSAILYNCGFSLTFVYNLYLSGMTVATCLIMYYCALKIFRRSNPALLASALYTFNSVRLTNILTRSAVGESTAQTFLPLIVLGFYQIYSAKKGEKITIGKYWPIIVGLTGVITSHTLSVVMCAIVILMVCIAFLPKTLQPARLWGLIKAAVWSLLVNLAPLIPMLDSMSMNIRVNSGISYIQGQGTYLLQIFNSIVNNYQRASVYGSAIDEMSMSIGFSVTLGLVFYIVCRVRIKSTPDKVHERTEFASACWGLTLAMIFLSSVYMCYDYLDFLPEKIYSLLTIFQYPWRWLSYAVLFGSFCAAAVADREEMRSLLPQTSVTMLLCIALIINTGQIYADHLSTSQDYRFANNLYEAYDQLGSPAYMLGMAEYLLEGVDMTQLYSRELIYEEDQLAVGAYYYENGRWLLEVENLTDGMSGVHIPLLCYDNYVAYDVDTGEIIDHVYGNNYRIYLYIPAGYSGTIVVEYRLPLLWKLAIGMSVATDAALLGYGVCLFRKKRGSFLKHTS